MQAASLPTHLWALSTDVEHPWLRGLFAFETEAKAHMREIYRGNVNDDDEDVNDSPFYEHEIYEKLEVRNE